MLVSGDSLETVLARIRNRAAPERLVETWLERYLEHFEGLVAQEKRSPMTLRELQRWAKPEGHFCWWFGRDIETLTNGQVQDWHAWLGTRINQHRKRPISLKTQKNVSDGFRRFLNWLEFREEIRRVPSFPPIETPEYLPQTLSMDQRADVLAAIPWERRGAFLAAAWMLMRPREVRAMNIDDYDPERNTLAVYKAFQGPQIGAPIRHTKNRSASLREVWQDELVEWIHWRLQQATPERRLAGEIALFWCPTAVNSAKRWTDEPLRKEWRRACKKVGVDISLYQGTKHSTATALAQGGIQPLVLKALGGWKDSKSVERYAKPEATRAAIISHLPRAKGTPD
jgi:integrase